jgi:hypothetical protein
VIVANWLVLVTYHYPMCVKVGYNAKCRFVKSSMSLRILRRVRYHADTHARHRHDYAYAVEAER